METVIHHHHEFVLYSPRNIEPMKVDMHILGQSNDLLGYCVFVD